MPLTPHERHTLLQLAQHAILHAVTGADLPAVPHHPGALAEKRGCFVTLTNAQRLRGCIGAFEPRSPLAHTVVEMAIEACRDPRFVYNPITPAELQNIKTEISVLSPLKQIDNPLSIQIGTHGIYIRRGRSAGCFLPEVATEMGWSAEEFLTQCCTGKAGMSGNSWKDPATEVLVFTSEKFDQ